MAEFVTAAGVRVELAACEPLVIDPVAIAFDPAGRMWVVEMRDYPYGPAEGETSASRLQILEDRDGDGFYEHGWTFAEGLPLPTGLQLWQGGAIVTLAGRVVYLADDDGDLRADREETWFVGFEEQNSQLRANHPQLAADGLIYVSNGLRGGTVKDARREAAEAISISGSDFRFSPDGTRYEAVAGMGQFGMTFDDWGHRFVCSNREPLMHAVLENRYLARNPRLAVPQVLHEVAASGEQSRVYALTDAWTTSTLHAGQFTAACGTHIYRGDALLEFSGVAFTCEPTGSLVHGERLTPYGATFTSQPLQAEAEFLASRDSWFRPVNLATGPDGALYVVDMYRAVIEHPDWMPEELRTRRDLLDGNDRGRIYRVTSAAASRDEPRVIDPEDADQLIALLDHANVWHRETAFRLLLEAPDKTSAAALRSLTRHGTTPAGRSLALSLLNGRKYLTADDVRHALADTSPLVQARAVRLAEPFLADVAIRESLGEAVIRLAESADPQVRFQAALTLGELGAADGATRALAKIAVTDVADPWTRIAVLSSAHGAELPLLDEVLHAIAGRENTAAFRPLLREIAMLIGSEQTADTAVACWTMFTADPQLAMWAPPILAGLCAGADRRPNGSQQLLSALESADTAAQTLLTRTFATAQQTARDPAALTDERLAAIELLRYSGFDQAGATLIELVASSNAPAQLRQAAIHSAAHGGDMRAAEQLLELYPELSPAGRQELLAIVLGRGAWTELLLDKIEQGEFVANLDPATTSRLRSHRNVALRARAIELLPSTAADRAAVVEQYRPALELVASPSRGKQLFTQHCATCHRIDGVGTDVGPDIADSRVKSPVQLLVDILDPNRAIDSNYVSYTVVTTDGRVHRGIVLTETSASLTLKQAEGRTLPLLREEIDLLESDGVSLMPEGFEKELPPEAMADLISYIKNWRYLDGAVPLAEPPASD